MSEASHPEEPAAVLAPGAEFSGLLVLHGAARIDGGVKGEVMGARVLWVGPDAVIEADLEADEILIAGTVHGDLRGRRRIELRPGARVHGAVSTARLVMAEGSRVEGPCRAGPTRIRPPLRLELPRGYVRIPPPSAPRLRGDGALAGSRPGHGTRTR